MSEKIFQNKLNECQEKFGGNTAIEYGIRRITYTELKRQSHCIANWIINKGIEKETFIGILAVDRVEFISSLVAVLKAGCVLVPLDSSNPVDRLERMMDTVCMTTILIDQVNYNKYSTTDFIKNRGIELVVIEDLLKKGKEEDFSSKPDIQNSSEDKIYIYFTSGTTGRPKAILGKNKSLLHYVEWEINTFNIDENFRLSQLAPTGFDAFLKEVFVTFLSGGTLCIPPNLETILNPEDLIAWIEKSQVHLLHCVPGLFRLLNSNRLTQENFTNLRFVLLSGDIIYPSDLVNWYDTFGERIQIVNLYGATETTILKTYYSIHKTDLNKKRIPIGKPIKGTRLIILDENMDVCNVGIVGEIYIRTPYRTFGYYNDHGLNKERFIPNPFNNDPEDIIYKTGDLGRFLPDGNVEFLGRVDRQVKIRGIRVELEEIEHILLEYPLIKEAVVIKDEIENNEVLSAYINIRDEDLVDEEKLMDEIKQHLRSKLPDSLVPAHLVRLRKIPRDINGKVKYDALPAPLPGERKEYIPPRNDPEKKLLEIWTEVLEFKKIGVNDSFFELGGNSLNVMSLLSKIHSEFDVRLSFGELFNNQTIEKQAILIQGTKKDKHTSIEAAVVKEYYALSSAQMRLYILQQMELDSIAYNIPQIVVLDGKPDKEVLEKTFKKLIKRHESLRSSFHMVAEEPVLRVHDNVELEIEFYQSLDNSHWSLVIEEITRDFVKPFDLSQAPLLRVGLLHLHTPPLVGQPSPTSPAGHSLHDIFKEESSKGKYILMVDMHHVISDGISLQILVRDFSKLYNGEELPLLRIQYKDFAEWQNSEKQREMIKQQKVYWLREFAGEIPVLNIPTDYARPMVQSFSGSTIPFEIGGEETKTLIALAAKEGTTLYAVLAAIFNVFLSKISSQEDIIIGTPIAGRRHVDLEQIIGMFVNTLALRNYPEGEKTFTSFLHDVKENMVKAFENQEYPFEDLVDQLSPDRDVGRNPLFDVMFVLQNMDPAKIEIPGLTLKPYHYENRVSKFDMTLLAMEAGETLLLTFEYCTKLFKKKSIHRLVTYFKRIVSAIANKPAIPLWKIQILSGKEKNQLLFDFNNTAVKYPKNKTLHQLFEEQVDRTPDNAALIFHDRKLTYQELNRRSNQLARILRKRGMKINGIVGIMLERSVEMIIAILAVLKSGRAYLPIDPDYPRERIDYMLLDSASKALITTQELSKEIKFEKEIIYLSDAINRVPTSPPLRLSPASATYLAYVIYTSGSTGKPHGVMVEHFSVINLAFCQKMRFNITGQDRVLQFSSISFDASVEQIFITLYSGAGLVLVDRETLLDKKRFEELLYNHLITHIHAVPSFLKTISHQGVYHFKRMISGGDTCSPALIKEWYNICDFYNEYGPTETTVTSIEYLVKKLDNGSTPLPIGKALDNTVVYILDRQGNPVPCRTVGELFIGGDGVARGYLNHPELTAEKFKVNPFLQDQRFYQTGDLVRWLVDGNIEFLGRVDHQVKIRGFRIDLGEIESHLLVHEGIKNVVVIARESTDKSTGDSKLRDKYLCAYFVSDKELAVPALRDYLSSKLPGYMVPSYFVQLEELSLMPNGKVKRKALPEPGPGGAGIEYAAPGDEVERRMIEIWSEVLGIERRTIGIDDNFFLLGGHSLRATVLTAKIHKKFDVKVPMVEVFKTPTIRGLARYIRGAKEYKYASIELAEEKEYYTLSSAQNRIFIQQQMDPESTAYNITQIVLLEGELEGEIFEETLKKLVKRHESFRTSFILVEGESMQKIHDEVGFKIQYHDSSPPETVGTLIENFIRPFDLYQAPLLRAGLVKEADKKYILMVDMHHIISDGVSNFLIIKEFMMIYRGEKAPGLRLRYKDFAEWQRRQMGTEEIKRQQAYWLNRFKGDIPVLELQTDFPRPPLQRFEGDGISFEIDPVLTKEIKAIAAKNGATLFMVLLAVYNILLSKYSGQDDIIVGAPVAGRSHKGLHNLIGMFINILVMKNHPGTEKSFEAFLKEVKHNTLQAFENQDYQFDDLLKQLDIKRDRSRNPLYDVVFAVQNAENAPLEIPGLKWKPYEYINRTCKTDLRLGVTEKEDKIDMLLTYSTALFKKETAEELVQYYIDILTQVVKNIRVKLKDISISHHLETIKLNVFRDDERDFNF